MSRFNLDFETRSPVDLTKCGANRYAEEADILLIAIAREDEPVALWDCWATEEQNAPALALLRELASDPAHTVWCFNVGFETAITYAQWERTLGFAPPALHQWRCSAALCRIAAIPASLERAAEFLRLPIKKDKAGSVLIKIFCIPRKWGGEWTEPTYPKSLTVAGEKMTAPDAWEAFRSYCITDVETERALGKRLASLELKGWMLDSFLLDLKMNALGVPVNLQAVGNARAVVDQYTERMTRRFQDITGLNPTQQVKVLAWMQRRGYPGANLQVGTVGEFLEEDDSLPDILGMTPEASEALRIKVMIGFAALKKLPTMQRAACFDGRIRGMFKWYGARTGRYSSGIVQLQNLKRPNHISEDCYRYIRDGGMCADSVELLFDSPLIIISKAIRHFCDPGEGRQFLDVDLSQIEARVLAWLAGHEELLQTFREGKDLYKSTIASVMGVDYDEVTKHQRTLAKAMVLACGYSGGKGAMDAACKMYQLELTDKEKRRMVKDWRKANKPITEFWKEVGDGVVEAVQNPGKWIRITHNVRAGSTGELGYRELVLELPSKRRLHYPFPGVRPVYKIKRLRELKPGEELDDDDDGKEWVEIPLVQALAPDGELRDGVWKTQEVTYWGQLKGSVNWGHVRFSGGTAVENLCQAVAGDFLNHGALMADRAGYDIALTVHDQLVTEYHPERGNSVEGLVAALCTLPPWAGNMPLDAVGSITEFLTKD
jgi:DNA polymerase